MVIPQREILICLESTTIMMLLMRPVNTHERLEFADRWSPCIFTQSTVLPLSCASLSADGPICLAPQLSGTPGAHCPLIAILTHGALLGTSQWQAEDQMLISPHHVAHAPHVQLEKNRLLTEWAVKRLQRPGPLSSRSDARPCQLWVTSTDRAKLHCRHCYMSLCCSRQWYIMKLSSQWKKPAFTLVGL